MPEGPQVPEPPADAAGTGTAPAPAPRRSRRWRFLPLALAAGGVVLWTQFCAPTSTDVVLVLPADAPAGAWDVRLVRLSDGAEARRARREVAPGARSLVLGGKLQRGRYRVEAWPAGAPPGAALEGTLEYSGDDVVEVRLGARAPSP